MARVGLEPTTLALLAPRSNQLSYPATCSFHCSLAKCCELTSFFKLQGLRVLGTRRPSSCLSAVAPKHLSNPSHLRRSCYTTNPTVEPDKKVNWAEAPLSKECCFGDSEVGHCLLLYERSVASYAMPFVFCPLFFGKSVCRCGQLSEKVVPQSTKTYGNTVSL
ncbi:hypothetical protein T07_7458 [Trichinella nelsoni]|uniref:Uncharacterized protein n=1 Tax=Trichinella nelsoni TaxID=6336 RepID=A0A0V0SFT7_9BILA|nr:hypothetical protein T07_7458 [Trichinella nelsoni]